MNIIQIVIVAIFALGGYAAFAWDGPTVDPSGNNTSAPIKSVGLGQFIGKARLLWNPNGTAIDVNSDGVQDSLNISGVSLALLGDDKGTALQTDDLPGSGSSQYLTVAGSKAQIFGSVTVSSLAHATLTAPNPLLRTVCLDQNHKLKICAPVVTPPPAAACMYYYKVGPIQHGCFIKDTLVTLADGTQKLIQDIAIGDVLKGEKTNNTVIGFDRPLLDKGAKLYSFNGGEYFVTEDHPFMTTTGWKAINPDLAGLKHQLGFDIGKLIVGDVLVTDTAKTTLTSITSKLANTNTQLYNFILNGDHTYYADGYLVHNKTDCQNPVYDPVSGQYTGGYSCSSPGWSCTNYNSFVPYQSWPPEQANIGGTCYKNTTGAPLTCNTPNDTPYVMNATAEVSPYFIGAQGSYVCYNGIVSFKTGTDLSDDDGPLSNAPTLNYQTSACNTGGSSSNPLSLKSVWYCHLGNWHQEGTVSNRATCTTENYPAGYKWAQTRVCTTAKLTGRADCEPNPGEFEYDLPAAPTSKNCTYSGSGTLWNCTN